MDIPRVITSYYLATPLFALLDFYWSAPIRAVAIPSPRVRAAYYAGCLAIGFLVRRRRRLAPAAGIAESSVNLTLLLAGILLAVYGMTDQVMAGSEPYLALPAGWPAAALLYGGVLILGIQGGIRTLGPQKGNPFG